MKLRILLFLLICIGAILLLPILAAASPTGALHAGVVHASAEKGVVVCAVNTADGKREAVIRLKNAPAGLKVAKAERLEAVKLGNPAKGQGDTARLVPVKVRLARAKGSCELKVSLARDSALTVVLRTSGKGP